MYAFLGESTARHLDTSRTHSLRSEVYDRDRLDDLVRILDAGEKG